MVVELDNFTQLLVAKRAVQREAYRLAEMLAPMWEGDEARGQLAPEVAALEALYRKLDEAVAD